MFRTFYTFLLGSIIIFCIFYAAVVLDNIDPPPRPRLPKRVWYSSKKCWLTEPLVIYYRTPRGYEVELIEKCPQTDGEWQ